MSKSEIYVPIEGEILHLTDGTPVKVQTVRSQYFTATRVDGQPFTKEQSGYTWEIACWQFTGKRGDHPDADVGGLSVILPNSKEALELKVKQLGGTITWTDPDVLRAREIWARHSRPNDGPESQYVLDGHSDNGAVMKALLEAIKSN